MPYQEADMELPKLRMTLTFTGNQVTGVTLEGAVEPKGFQGFRQGFGQIEVDPSLVNLPPGILDQIIPKAKGIIVKTLNGDQVQPRIDSLD